MTTPPEKTEMETRNLVAKTVDYLTSPEGKQALRAAADESKRAVEPFRRARNVPQERLNRRFTI